MPKALCAGRWHRVGVPKNSAESFHDTDIETVTGATAWLPQSEATGKPVRVDAVATDTVLNSSKLFVSVCFDIFPHFILV